MFERDFRTASGGRLRFISSLTEGNYNWLFLPGGPGLGSEVLAPLTEILNLPGTIWHFDLPGDGSNLGSIECWSQAIIEAATALENVIFVGHSSGGLFLQAVPELEKILKGLVLLDTSPDRTWQDEFAKKALQYPLPEADKLAQEYLNNPSDESLKRYVLASAPHFFTTLGLEKGIKSLENLPYDYNAIQWTRENFDPTYETKWIPQQIPTRFYPAQKI
jgi:pimeloyl-ACP methyl ester carboxylesterase